MSVLFCTGWEHHQLHTGAEKNATAAVVFFFQNATVFLPLKCSISSTVNGGSKNCAERRRQLKDVFKSASVALKFSITTSGMFSEF